MKYGGIKKSVCMILVFAFSVGQIQTTGFADENLATWTVTGKNPMRPDVLEDIATKFNPGAVGNGRPLVELVKGKLPAEIEIDEKRRKKIVKKLREAVNLAISLHLKNRDKIPTKHQARAKKTLSNLFSFRSNIEKGLYFYDAFNTVTTPEDYLAGFSYGERKGKDPLLVERLDAISVLRLAQDLYRDSIPEYLKIKKGKFLSEEVEREDYETIYSEIQTAIFGEDEVKALGEDYRAFIEEALFLKEEVTEIIELAEEYVVKDEMEKDFRERFNQLTAHSLNPIVRTIGMSAMYMKAETDYDIAERSRELKAFTAEKARYPIAAAIAQSAFYGKAIYATNGLNEKSALLKQTFENGIHPIAKEIAGQALKGELTLMEILSGIQTQLLEKRNVYGSVRMDEIVKYEKMLKLDESFMKYMGYKVFVREKPEVSRKINALIESAWEDVNLKEPFADDTQKKLEIIVELDKFRAAKRVSIAGKAYTGVCYARLFGEGNWQYTIDFMREVKEFSEKRAKFKEFVFKSEHFLQLYLVSCFMSPEFFYKAEIKRFEIKQSMKIAMTRVAFDELFGAGSQNIFTNIFSREATEIINKTDEIFSGFIEFYEKTGRHDKAIELIDTMLRTSLLSSSMCIDGIENCFVGKLPIDFSFQKELLEKWRAKIVKKRNDSSKLIQFMKEFKEKDMKFTAILQEIESFDNYIRLGGLSRLIEFEEIINLEKEGGTALDLVYRETFAIFEALSGADGDANILENSEIKNWANFLRKIASLYLERNNRAKIIEITEALESKMRAIRIADNDICPALADIQMDLEMYDEAKEIIRKIDNNEAIQIDLLIRMGKQQAEEGKTIEARQTLREASAMLEEYCDSNGQFDKEYKALTMGRIGVVERSLKMENKLEKQLQDVTYFPAGLRFLQYTALGRTELEGKVVYVKLGCDVPFDEKKALKDLARITDPMRIDVALPTLEHIVSNGGKVVLQPGWIKRPKGIDKNLSVIPVFLDIRKKLLEKGIIKSENEMILVPTDLETETAHSVYQNVNNIQRMVQKELREGDDVKIVCLENPRFDEEYDEGDQNLTKKIAEMVDLAIFDDYNQQHRPVSDIKFLPKLVPSYVGKHLGEEIQIADQLLKKLAEPDRKPSVLILGGKKIETKPGKVSKVKVALNSIKNGLIRRGDKILVGGGVSYAFLVAEKYLERIKNDSDEINNVKVAKISTDDIRDVIGDSYISDELFETDEGLKEAHKRISTCARLLLEAGRGGVKVILPRVHKIRNIETGEVRTGQTQIPRGWYAIDIDGASITEYKREIKGIGIGVMAGPMGIMDDPDIPEAVEGTDKILRALKTETQENGAFTLSAGGETTQQAVRIDAKLSYRSVGGGMTLEVIEKQGETHGLLALSESARNVLEKILKDNTRKNDENLQLTKLDITCHAEFLKHNLMEWRKRHPNEVLVLAFDNDIGKCQQTQIMPLWKIVDAVKKMTDSSGHLLFPKGKIKEIRRDGSNGDLMREIDELLKSGKTVKENIFLVGQKANIDAHQFDSLKKASWIAGIDDTGVEMEIYLPVFEALALMIMSELGASEASIKEYYDEISGKEISMRLFREMIKNKLIYVFPKMDRKIKNLRQFYETVQIIHIAV